MYGKTFCLGVQKSICIPGQKEISFVQTVILVPGGRNEIFGWPGHGYLKTVICIFHLLKFCCIYVICIGKTFCLVNEKSICIPGQKEISFVLTVTLVPGGRKEIFGWPGHEYIKTVVCFFFTCLNEESFS